MPDLAVIRRHGDARGSSDADVCDHDLMIFQLTLYLGECLAAGVVSNGGLLLQE
jgi:hypothetical protein